MALIYEMYIWVPNDSGLDPMIRHFDGFSCRLHSGKEVGFQAGRDQDPLAISVSSRDLRHGWAITPQHTADVSEAGIRLHERLLAAPPFRGASFGCNASCCFEIEELDDDVRPGNWHGLREMTRQVVINEEVWRRVGSPQNMLPFRPGYWWIPYWGQPYLTISGQGHPFLHQLRKEFFG